VRFRIRRFVKYSEVAVLASAVILRPLLRQSLRLWFRVSLLAVTLDIPLSSPRHFRRLLSEWESGLSAILSASPAVIEIRVSSPLLHVRAFSWVEQPTMPSADFCCSFLSPFDDSSTQAEQQISPGIAHSPSRLCPPHLRQSLPCRYWTLKIFAFSSSFAASYAIPVGRASVLPAASSRFHLTIDTLAVRLTIPPTGFVWDFHPQVNAPCRAHITKRGRAWLCPLHTNRLLKIIRQAPRLFRQRLSCPMQW
jgi:hypothetical protein